MVAIRERKRACHRCEFFTGLAEGDRESYDESCGPKSCELNAYLGHSARRLWDRFTELREWSRDVVLVAVVQDAVRGWPDSVLRAWIAFNRELDEAAAADEGR